jgi:pimeloyl-ACP methyl ester carboxylesterase
MANRRNRKIGIIFGIILILLLFGPFLIPVPALKDMVTPDKLADPDSKFINVNGLNIHYKIYGQGEPVIVLLHGFGASLFSWREVTDPLSKIGTVIAYDRPAFGLTERPVNVNWGSDNLYSNGSQDKLLIGLLDALKINKAILIGNSAGGTAAVLTALNYPERVSALILVDAAILNEGGAPQWISWIFNFPQIDRLGPLFVRNIKSWGLNLLKSAWHDPLKITPFIIDGFEKPLQIENWDKALWQLTKSSKPLNLRNKIIGLKHPILVLSGDDDRIVPTQDSVELAKIIPNQGLVLLANCGHVPQEECPQQFLDSVVPFIQELKFEED